MLQMLSAKFGGNFFVNLIGVWAVRFGCVDQLLTVSNVVTGYGSFKKKICTFFIKNMKMEH